MTDKWDAAKKKLKDRDLDAEFEKFLNESLSDESSASPKRSVTPRASKARLSSTTPAGKPKFDLPWWANSEDDETVASEIGTKQWLKKQKSLDASDITQDDVDVGEPAMYTQQQKPATHTTKEPQNPLTMSKDSLDGNTSRPGTGLDTILSESEPSYSELAYSKAEELIERGSDNNDESDSFTGGQTSLTSTQISVTRDTSTAPQQPGMETLEEIQDKELFFSKLEENVETGVEKANIDYGKLNEELDAGKWNWKSLISAIVAKKVLQGRNIWKDIFAPRNHLKGKKGNVEKVKSRVKEQGEKTEKQVP